MVEGAHAWLIADPAAFGELAISALVDSGALDRPRSAMAAGLTGGRPDRRAGRGGSLTQWYLSPCKPPPR